MTLTRRPWPEGLVKRAPPLMKPLKQWKHLQHLQIQLFIIINGYFFFTVFCSVVLLLWLLHWPHLARYSSSTGALPQCGTAPPLKQHQPQTVFSCLGTGKQSNADIWLPLWLIKIFGNSSCRKACVCGWMGFHTLKWRFQLLVRQHALKTHVYIDLKRYE